MNDKQRERSQPGQPSIREVLPAGLLLRGKTLMRDSQSRSPTWALTRKQMKYPNSFQFIECACTTTNLTTADIRGAYFITFGIAYL